jgi:hypothetical protein
MVETIPRSNRLIVERCKLDPLIDTVLHVLKYICNITEIKWKKSVSNWNSWFFSTDYQVFCGIQIKNYTKYELFDPDIKTTLGSVMLPPRRIGPHEAGIVVSRK